MVKASIESHPIDRLEEIEIESSIMKAIIASDENPFGRNREQIQREGELRKLEMQQREYIPVVSDADTSHVTSRYRK